MRILPEETRLIGSWIVDHGVARGDATDSRIKDLTENYLLKLGISKKWGAWETLFQDPGDGRYWEKTFPHSGLHGGGPPELRCLTPAEAKSKYPDLVLKNPPNQ